VDAGGRETVSPVVTVMNESTAAGFDIGLPYPLPAADRSWLDIALAEAQPVSILLYDALGRLVRTVRDDVELATGSHAVAIPLADLPPGQYAVLVQGRTFSAARRIVVR
jgi:hypothetical protein